MNLNDIHQLRSAYEIQCVEVIRLGNRVTELEEELAQLKELLLLQRKRQFGKKTEISTDTTELQTVAAYTRQPRGRGPRFDTSALPRYNVIHDLPDEKKQCACCGHALHHMGQEISAQVEIIPARYWVIEHTRMKYGCRQCDKVVMADKPYSPIPKAAAGASLLTDVLVNKYHYHLPLYRQSKMMKSHQFVVPDNTIGNWVMKSGEALMPMADALWDILTSGYLQVDETPVQVLASDKKGYIWAYYAPYVGKGLVVFEFSETRSGLVAENRLKNYKGILQTDGYAGYHRLRQKPTTAGCGCLTHSRRKFDEVVKITGDTQGIAASMIQRLKPLYALEARMRERQDAFHTRKRLRQKIALPLLKKIHHWLRLQRPKVPPKSQLAKAIDYTLNQWPYLIAYCRHGMAEIDTNAIENKIREIALGRKNWLFIGNANSGKVHALFFSLVASCVLNELNPRVYLHYLLTQVHAIRKKEIDPVTLLPDRIDRNKLATFIDEQMVFAQQIMNST